MSRAWTRLEVRGDGGDCREMASVCPIKRAQMPLSSAIVAFFGTQAWCHHI